MGEPLPGVNARPLIPTPLRTPGPRFRPAGKQVRARRELPVHVAFDEPGEHGQMRAMRPDASAPVARLGRRLGILAFAVLVASVTANWSFQILRQVFWAESPPRAVSCREGLLELERAIARARSAAAFEARGERAALASFRDALEPEWHYRGAVAQACREDALGRAALSELDALRYAEEHAVRYEAGAVAAQRRRAEAILRELRGAPTR